MRIWTDFSTDLRWLVVRAPPPAEPLHDGSRLGGTDLSFLKPSNLCRRHKRWTDRQKTDRCKTPADIISFILRTKERRKNGVSQQHKLTSPPATRLPSNLWGEKETVATHLGLYSQSTVKRLLGAVGGSQSCIRFWLTAGLTLTPVSMQDFPPATASRGSIVISTVEKLHFKVNITITPNTSTPLKRFCKLIYHGNTRVLQ